MNKIIILLIVLLFVSFDFTFTVAKKSGRKGVRALSDNEVLLSDGPIRGTTIDSHRVFYGIPFASPPIGELRYEDPQPPKPWNYVRDGTKQREQCIQKCELGDGSCSEVGTSEDCLYLDVFIPRNISPGSKVPVMVFIPGGAFTQGTGSCPLYDSSKFANSSVIVVNVNYRLGVLGFLCTNILSGNFGFLDQVMALDWVQENIEVFGGDKDQVTLYGQSAGAFSVAAHLSSEKSAGKFHRAILSSSPFTVGLKSQTVARGFAQRFSNKIGCDIEDIDCHRSKSPEEVLAIQREVSLKFGDKILDAFTIWSPVVDDVNINGQPLTMIKEGTTHDVPTIIGDVQDEARIFVYMLFKKNVLPISYKTMVRVLFGLLNGNKVLDLYPSPGFLQDCRPILSKLLTDYLFRCPGRYSVVKSAQLNESPVFHYFYNHVSSAGHSLEQCEGMVCHGSELPMVFNTYESGFDQDLDEDEKLFAEELNNYFANFVKYGNPSQPNGLPTPKVWSPTTKTTNTSLIMKVGFETKDIISNDPKCDLFDKISYNGYTKDQTRMRKNK
ncbi:hypothetical protein RB653_000645 [Dictyostelium firmibasis]|uniref:Carboxylic ester hydrolase n=1 Tax=Dictyostelium firmibasis TaxID=79012 RepID=A0AAN7UFM2_9MYCE